MRGLAVAVLLAAGGWAGAAEPLVGAALPLAGFRVDVSSPGVVQPQFGPVVECDSIERQFVLLNSDVVVGEPVEFRLMLRNLLPGMQKEFKARLAHNTDLRFVITPPQGQAYPYRGMNRGTIVPNSVLSMERVAHFRIPVRLGSDSDTVTGAAFDVPGRYRLDAFLACIGVTPDPIDMYLGEFFVNVRAPEGDDARAMEIMSDYRIFDYLHTHSGGSDRDGSLINEAQRNMLRRVINEAPRAAVRPHAMFALAHYLENQGDPEEAEALLLKVEADYPDSIYSVESIYTRLRARLNRDDIAGARPLLESMWQDPAETQMFYPGSASWNRFFSIFHPKPAGSQWMVFENPLGPDPEAESTGAGPMLVIDPQALRDLEALGMRPEDLQFGVD